MTLIDHRRENLDASYRRRSEDDFLTFCGGLVIPSQQGPLRFIRVMADFQRSTFHDLAPSLHAVRDGGMPPVRRFWIERTKKAGKDSDLAACLLWLLAFPRKPTYIQVGAADRDQANIIRQRLKDLVHYNEWIRDRVDVQQYKVRDNRGLATLDIMAADIAGAHGGTPDLLVMNELSHVTRWEFLENLMDNADGVRQGVAIVATNAGYRGTKAWIWRENAVNSKGWHVHIWDKPAPWHDEAALIDARRRNPAGRYNRLWLGKWQSGKGDALTDDDVARIFRPELIEQVKPESGWWYVAGLDLGVSHDHAGLVILGVDQREQRLRVATTRWWAPNPKTGEVDLTAVEEACLGLAKTFRVGWFGYDPHQAKLMAQRLTRRGVPTREVAFTGQNMNRMASALVQAVESGVLESHVDERLRADFAKFSIVERSYGLRLEAVSDEEGHADVGTALAICLPAALDMLAGRRGLSPDDVLVEEDDSELTDEELEEMPDDLRDIYELEDDLAKEGRYNRRAGMRDDFWHERSS